MAEMIDVGFYPELIHPTAWIAPGAVLVGRVHLGEQASVWYGAVLRGDLAAIRVGARSNIQDGCVIHVDRGMPATIGADVVLGHGAVVHAATVQDGCLIAIRAVVLSGAVIGAESIIGAGAVVTERTVVPPRSLVLGIPGRVVRKLSDQEVNRTRVLAAHYVRLAQVHARHRPLISGGEFSSCAHDPGGRETDTR